MLYEILEVINIVIASSSEYPYKLFKAINKLADSNYLIDETSTLYMRIYVLMMLSENPNVLKKQ